MKVFLLNISQELLKFSDSLDKKSILIDKPWSLIDVNGKVQKFIFRKDDTLLISTEGKVIDGNWDYLSEAKALLIEKDGEKILYNVLFVNSGVVVLKIDGVSEDHYVLINENLVPNLDWESYLIELRRKLLNAITFKLKNGGEVDICFSQRQNIYPEIGDQVFMRSFESIVQGRFELVKYGLVLTVENGVITHRDFPKERINSNIREEQKREHDTSEMKKRVIIEGIIATIILIIIFAYFKSK